jgi:hypothetical protein
MCAQSTVLMAESAPRRDSPSPPTPFPRNKIRAVGWSAGLYAQRARIKATRPSGGFGDTFAARMHLEISSAGKGRAGVQEGWARMLL